jgi:hypothetical protein
VGEASNLLGLAKLPATKNGFYDQHVIGFKGRSLLHDLKKPTCKIECEQTYDCGGRRFGPKFVISYSLTRKTIKGAKQSYDVTEIDLTKTAKP